MTAHLGCGGGSQRGPAEGGVQAPSPAPLGSLPASAPRGWAAMFWLWLFVCVLPVTLRNIPDERQKVLVSEN